ncbi:MAG: peroxide stress protein YaaA [Hydrogenophaga sp.]|uniref:peroxide stress protein YaaA n=1 Tax=Hydrogenophaga sp. TaxID=1904254 RepID=UPI001DE2BFCD|nr:peroxide stress protein YaaA [Hydrogenophaga sp.]MBX3610100.1 peroxide stress protein YaaA [Hydrogenophaga sp.]
MLFVISPAKALDYETPPHIDQHSRPLFVPEASELVAVMRRKSPQQIAELMDLSDKLAALNAARYEAWRPSFTAKNSKQAVLAFDGDVYGGLDAKSLDADELDWLQQHLCILSGLYGVLRPLDRMQPYRLEMGTRLKTAQGNSLYAYWGSRIAEYLNQRARADKSPVLVNLASEEYFRAVDLKVLQPRVVTCVFEERKGVGYKIISFNAKRARGLMVRWALKHRAATPEQLKAFDIEGYRFEPTVSGPDRYVFRRDAQT